jgi:hypothetical protein
VFFTLPNYDLKTMVREPVRDDILINIRVSLTVGRRWRTAPASHALTGAGEFAGCANRSAAAASERVFAAVARRNSRRLLPDATTGQ